MKKYFSLFLVLSLVSVSFAAPLRQPNPIRQHGKEEGMILDLNKITLGTLNDVEEKKQYLSTVQLEKQRIQNYMLRQVYENAYTLYRHGDYQRAQELAQTILSIDPNFTQASTLAKQAANMGAYGTISEAEVVEAKFQEANRMYDSGRLVEANEKLDEILTIQPYNSKAAAWKKRVDKDIAQEYNRRGDVAYEEQDYQRALDNWYNALIIRKDDPALVNRIAQTENLLRKQQVKELMEEAMTYYNQGRFTESYAMFERITKIQPGDIRAQRYMMQLKEEIIQTYFTAGNNSYRAQKYDSAINYWTSAKKWGADASHMDRLIKQARNAKEDALRRRQEAVQQAAEQAAQQEAEQEPEPIEEEPIETVTVESGGNILQPSGSVPGTDVNSVTDGIGGAATRVSPEATAASRQKYLEGLAAYQQNDYERAREAWIAARQLDPGNTDAAQGLRTVEELTGVR